jgi:hypothetical protein
MTDLELSPWSGSTSMQVKCTPNLQKIQSNLEHYTTKFRGIIGFKMI